MADFVPVNIAYKVFNPANGADDSLSPVIFLHGMNGTKEIWDDIPQVIADRSKRKVFATDARNHGDSDYTDGFSFDMNVDDLFHFMDTMKIPKAVLVGQSMGGYSACHAAMRKPERIEKVFIEDIALKKLPQDFIDQGMIFAKLWMEVVKNIPNNLNETEAMKFAVDTLFSKLPPGTPNLIKKDAMSKVKFSFKRTPTGGYEVKSNKDVIIRAAENIGAMTSDPSGTFNGPAYFLYGELSPMQVGKEEENIKKHFPKAELIEFKGAAHTICFEFRDEFVETILEHL